MKREKVRERESERERVRESCFTTKEFAQVSDKK